MIYDLDQEDCSGCPFPKNFLKSCAYGKSNAQLLR